MTIKGKLKEIFLNKIKVGNNIFYFQKNELYNQFFTIYLKKGIGSDVELNFEENEKVKCKRIISFTCEDKEYKA